MSYQLEEWPVEVSTNQNGESKLALEWSELTISPDGKRIHETSNATHWWTREKVHVPGSMNGPVKLHFEGGVW